MKHVQLVNILTRLLVRDVHFKFVYPNLSPNLSQIITSQLGNCYDINSLPCGSHCGPACSTPETINFINNVDSECINHPTGVSHRVPIWNIDGVQSCNSFGFCRNGHYYTDDCTPGQYFDEYHCKSTCNTCF